ncbi:hypothetical protein DSO57_1022182 [Entomophthora muscae]|uniref:Uncharacterized protein n=1 Tax=Entomophthora muscae TaxID=34485 RepID=A0ACC2TQP6_9FUNG|nr:hypothetical protein DSO57_1022182 [Entomophthora muscae]
MHSQEMAPVTVPREVMAMMAEMIPVEDRNNLARVSKSWFEVVMPHIWREPEWKVINQPLDQLSALLDKYGEYVRVLPLSDNVGLERIQLLLSKCPRLYRICFYGTRELWTSISSLVPCKSIESAEFFFIGDINSETLEPLAMFSRLTELSLTYDSSEYINQALKLIPENQLRSFSALQITQLQTDTLDLIHSRFPLLEVLQVQCGSIEETAYVTLDKPMPRLHTMEIDVLLFKNNGSCLALNGANFPRLRSLLIDLHVTRTAGFCCLLSGTWPRLASLSLFRLNTSNNEQFNKEQFPILQSLQLQVYQPFTSETLALLLTDFPRLENVELNKFDMADDLFDLPTPLSIPSSYSIKNFSVTSNHKPLGKNYLSFMIKHMCGMREWILPKLIEVDDPTQCSCEEATKCDTTEKPVCQVEQLVQWLIKHEVPELLPNLERILVDASATSIPLVHYLAQSCQNLNYLFINILNDDLDLDELHQAFDNINPKLTVKIE